MTTPVEKATALIRKAMSTQSEEEARTCAFLAVKIVVRERLELISPSTVEKIKKAAESRRAEATHAQRARGNRDPFEGAEAFYRPPRRPRPTGRPADAPSRTSFASACLFCEKELNPGDKVFYSKIFEVMVCPECFEAEILLKRRMDDLGERARQRRPR
jgi:hypothetical protein